MNALHLPNAEFRSLAARVTDLAADLLAGLEELPAFPAVRGEQVARAFEAPLPEEGLRAGALDALGEVLALSRAPTPRFYGYVLGSGEPVAALADLLASILNQNVTAWRSAPAAVSIERQMVRGLAGALGCEGLTGSLCGGGSMANLMGLAMAREARLPANQSGAQPGVVYASSEVHMSIPKAMALLGLGRENLRLIGADEAYRLDPQALRTAIAADRSAGRTPLAVVATGGSVNTGAIDPLPEIAAVCREQQLWLHVDGAYGALAALAIPERFTGLSAADSLSLDPHKWLYQPLDCGMLLFRNAHAARTAFSCSGDYAKSLAEDPLESFAFFDESLELSRRFRALKLWLSLRYHGLAAFRSAIRSDLRHAQNLAELIRGTPTLELLAPVELSAVCFRYRSGEPGAAADRLNAAILKRVIERGRVYLSNATLRGRFALRACFVNHRTTDRDVGQIVPEVLDAARELLGS
ncbi:MAG: aminotransferase class V-fold PLP-dependent enzyme [Gammaproteobacteria bacterium]|nr:MAG: aminotransferase class V-fold PLP-dependent enzyme [Gammaproteobacteria bacterium]TLY87292.1 MAG: aminotransferase class V-fold PLP-dependent enzyme [Gammaproteobacteria bacterium]